MAQPYIGEIRMFAGIFAPVGWAFCNGALISISENETLYNLIGTTYGGDGVSNFALPNLLGRVPLHQGGGFQVSDAAGVESVTLTIQQIPVHNHAALASSEFGTATSPTNNVLAKPNTASTFLYINEDPSAAMANNIVTPVGGSQPHENMQPYLCINFIISLFGIFPTQT